jgi:hypothetical protein
MALSLQLPLSQRTMEKIWTLLMQSARTFTSEPPKGWIRKDKLLAETGIGDRRLADWGPRLGLRTCLVSHGRGGMESYYQPDSIRTVKHFLELSANTPRDTDERLWRLWLEEENVDIIAWAKKHLDSGLIELGRGRSDSIRLLRNRVRKPMHRAALAHYSHLVAAGRAGPACETSLFNADPPIWNLLLNIAGLPHNAPLPFGELRNIEQRYSVANLHRVLETSTDDEIKQARRDWQMFGRWAEAAGTIDWNMIGPALDAKITSLTGSPRDPPSWRARKTQRRRPSPPPPIVQFFIAFWPELSGRVMLLPMLMDLRRSPIWGPIITMAAATIDLQLERLPRRASTTPRGTAE